MKGCDHLRTGAFGGGVEEPHSSCLHLHFSVHFCSLYLSSSLASFLVWVLAVTVTLLKRLTLQCDTSAIRVGKYTSWKIMRSLEGRRLAQSLSLRQRDCGGEAPSREALKVIELDISLRHVQEDYTSCDVMAIERPKIHLRIRLWRKSERQNSNLMDGNIKKEK